MKIPEIPWNLKSLLEIPEISRNIIDAPGKFSQLKFSQLKYDNMPNH